MDIAQAKREIAIILSSLENDSGSVIRYLGLLDKDITKFGDNEQQFLRGIDIQIERLPGTNWEI